VLFIIYIFEYIFFLNKVGIYNLYYFLFYVLKWNIRAHFLAQFLGRGPIMSQTDTVLMGIIVCTYIVTGDLT